MPSFIEIPPLSTEIRRHAKYDVDGRTDKHRPDGLTDNPKTQCSPSTIVGGILKKEFTVLCVTDIHLETKQKHIPKF